MDYLVDSLVAQPALDLASLRALDASQFVCVEVHETAGELAAAGLVDHRDHIARGKLPLDAGQARGQKTPSLLS